MNKKEEIFKKKEDYKFSPSHPKFKPGQHVWVICEGKVKEALVRRILYKHEAEEWGNWGACKVIEMWEYILYDTYNDEGTNSRPEWRMFASKTALKDYLFKGDGN